MKILICTGIYPPDVGGPSEYAKNLEENWQKMGHEVSVSVFSRWNFLPTGVRHVAYFFSILSSVFRSDFVIALDTFSAALPATVASQIFRKKIIVRTGGDFLWEWYVERTGEMVPLKEFYLSCREKFIPKENIIFNITKYILNNVSAVVWSADFQKDVFMVPYELVNQKHFVVENYYGQKELGVEHKARNFIAISRSAKLKNIKLLKEIFSEKEIVDSGAIIETDQLNHDLLIEKIKSCYVVVLASISEVSPNTINDAIVYGKPFLVTKEVGTYDRIKDVAIFVDPKSKDDIREKIFWILDQDNYNSQKEKLRLFSYSHSWQEMASEYISIYNKLT